MKESLNIASISDIHLGHNLNKSSEIIKNLRIAFPDNAETHSLDIIFIVGDVFDSLLSLNDSDLTEIDLWIASLIDLCAKHDICLRILEGTPSHDWKQSERFTAIATLLNTTADVKYVSELAIEYISKFDINVLYIPDEWQATTERTLSDVHELMKAKGLTQVDFACMHGCFNFQLPEHIKTHKHDEQAYLSIVKHLIFIGHIHNYSWFDRIYAQGSPDRLSHGDENPKGHLRARVTNDGYKVKFVETKGAKIFKTIDCTGIDLTNTMELIDNVIFKSKFPDGSFIRVLADYDNPVLSNMSVLIRKYPLLCWSKLAKTEVIETTESRELIESEYVPITITNSNIKSLLMDRVMGVTEDAAIALVAEKLLDSVINK